MITVHRRIFEMGQGQYHSQLELGCCIISSSYVIAPVCLLCHMIYLCLFAKTDFCIRYFGFSKIVFVPDAEAFCVLYFSTLFSSFFATLLFYPTKCQFLFWFFLDLLVPLFAIFLRLPIQLSKRSFQFLHGLILLNEGMKILHSYLQAILFLLKRNKFQRLHY